MLSRALLLASCATLAACARPDSGARGAASAPPARNLLLISVDTLRADALGCYGSTSGASPAIDAFARGAIVFENAWSLSCKTAPSHATMFTGLPPRVNGIDNFDTPFAHELPVNSVTLAETLRASHFRTGAITSGGNVRPTLGFGRGFESYDALGMQKLEIKLAGARRWLAEHGPAERWFLFFHTYRVHDPYLPPADLIGRYCDPNYAGRIVGDADKLLALTNEAGGKGLNLAAPAQELGAAFWKRADFQSPTDRAYLKQLYTACVADLDRQLGAFLEELRASGRLDDTLVVLTSDHGEEFGEHGKLRHDQLWQEHLHVPLIVRLPGGRAGGLRIREDVRHLDLASSLLELLDVGDTAPLRMGTSWAPWIGDPAARQARATLAEHRSAVDGPLDLWALRSGRWLLHKDRNGLHSVDRSLDPLELDPRPERPETVGLRAEVERDQALLEQLHGAHASGAAAALDAQALAELRNLGYL